MSAVSNTLSFPTPELNTTTMEVHAKCAATGTTATVLVSESETFATLLDKACTALSLTGSYELEEPHAGVGRVADSSLQAGETVVLAERITPRLGSFPTVGTCSSLVLSQCEQYCACVTSQCHLFVSATVSGECLWADDSGAVSCATFLIDRVVSGLLAGSTIKVRSYDGDLEHTLDHPNAEMVHRVTTCPTTLRLATTSTADIVVWSATDRPAPESTLRWEDADSLAVAIAMRGDRVVSGHDDGVVRVFCISTGQCVAVCPIHRDEAMTVAISCDGRWFASGGEYNDRLAYVFSTETNEPEHTLDGHTIRVSDALFTPSFLLLRSLRWSLLYDLDTWTPRKIRHTDANGFGVPAAGAVLTRCGRYLFSGHTDGYRVYNVAESAQPVDNE